MNSNQYMLSVHSISADIHTFVQAIAAQSWPCAKLEEERLVVQQISHRVDRVGIFKAGLAGVHDEEFRYEHPYRLVPAACIWVVVAEAHPSSSWNQD